MQTHAYAIVFNRVMVAVVPAWFNGSSLSLQRAGALSARPACQFTDRFQFIANQLINITDDYALSLDPDRLHNADALIRPAVPCVVDREQLNSVVFADEVSIRVVNCAPIERSRPDESEGRLVIVSGTKQISWLSILSATFRPSECAISRIWFAMSRAAWRAAWLRLAAKRNTIDLCADRRLLRARRMESRRPRRVRPRASTPCSAA
jgi:hypothetical protein